MSLPTFSAKTATDIIFIIIFSFSEAWHKKLQEYGDWFKAEENVKANEALRPGKPTNYDELFGIEGSFRQLSID
jgi:hypothetical protein